MKIIITENQLKKIIDEVTIYESTEDYYDKIVNELEPPYFRNLRTMGIPKKQYETIFSKLYNQPVSLSKDEVVDSNGNRLYFEESRGEWEEYKYDDNGNQIYYENSEGEWSKREYDNNNNLIFTKQIGGYWEKREYDDIGNLIFIEKLGPYGSHWNKYEYDDNGNKIYNEDSSGHWIKKEYDEYGNQIYSINSNGYIIDKRNNGNLNESTEDYYDKIVNILEPPYVQNLEVIGIDKDHYKLIFEKLFNQPVSVGNYDVLNSNRKEIYFENSDGYWRKTEYDDKGKLIYYENSNGYREKKDYNENGKLIYFENSDGYWDKRDYDGNGNIIYSENSDGYWLKREFDDNGNVIYYENSRVEIIDKRNNN